MNHQQHGDWYEYGFKCKNCGSNEFEVFLNETNTSLKCPKCHVSYCYHCVRTDFVQAHNKQKKYVEV